MTRGQHLLYFLFKILPTRFLSRLTGTVTRLPLPSFILDKIISWYKGSFSVREEYLVPEGGFRTFNAFFTRKLRKEFTAVDAGETSIVSPVEGRIDQFGSIDSGRILQAKDTRYTVRELIPFDISEKFAGGSFITLYLSPADYHRIHTPVHGEIFGYSIVPGRLKTVQEFMVEKDPRLFTGNERINTYIGACGATVIVCKIGAMNVGSISLSYREGTRTNRFMQTRKEVLFPDNEKVPVQKGDEIGIFNLGSTVICLFEPGFMDFANDMTSRRIRLGEKIGTVR